MNIFAELHIGSPRKANSFGLGVFLLLSYLSSMCYPAELPAAMRDPNRSITIVALQAGRSHSSEGNPGTAANFECFSRMAREAAKNKPDLILFPEYALLGWPYPSAEVVSTLAEAVPGDGPWYQRYRRLARELRTPLAGWMLEAADGKLYNCAFVLNAQGDFVGKYRKVHANLGEQTWWGWSQGDSFQPIELNGIKFGFSICADMWFPETVRCSELHGADVILHQSIADDMQHLVPTRAIDSKLPIVMSIFQGGCYAVDAQGQILDKLPVDEPGWQAFSIRPFTREIGTKYGGQWNIKLGWQNVRNPSAYEILVDPRTRPAWTSVFFDHEGAAQSREQLISRFNGRYDASDPELVHTPLIGFQAPWTTPFSVDPQRPFQLVNQQDEHLFILNKTAWAYFGCDNPHGVLERAKSQGVNLLRVALEGMPYMETLGIDLWPYGGTRDQPDWSTFNEEYWNRVEERTKLAGDHGIGLDIVLNMHLHPEADEVEQQRAYWQETLRRLGKYANVAVWEIANEYVDNEAFQDEAGRYFSRHDIYRRPVCTSAGTTDDAIWPEKEWIALAINHSCTSSTAQHDLADWYLAIARNTRSHGKPAFCNESGREKRHRNDDGVHRRKQGWLWCTAGGFWTWHSWDGCEGINDLEYRAPGEEFLMPMAKFFRGTPFSDLAPNSTACVIEGDQLVQTALSTADRSCVVAYACTRETGATSTQNVAHLRLPAGDYAVSFIRPADGAVFETRTVSTSGYRQSDELRLRDFKDDLAIIVQKIAKRKQEPIPGTR